MSLERTALRIGTVMALSNAFDAPYPTIAANRVFDSRIDPIQGINVGERAPLAIVYTDDDDREGLSQNNGGPPWRQHVNLVIELSIGLVGALVDENDQPMKDDAGNPLTTLLPGIETEPELEAMLDLFEAQVERLFRQPPNTWARRLLDDPDPLVVRVENWSSKRYIEREGQVRLAARQIVAKIMLPQPAEPAIVDEAPGDDDEITIPAPLGPLLDAIIEDDGPYGPSAAALQELLIDNGGFGPLVLPPLTKVRIKESDLGGGKRPDGVAQVALPQD